MAAVFSGAPSTLYALATARDPLEASLAAGHLALPHESRRGRLLIAAAVSHAALSLGWTVVLARLPRRGALVGACAGAVIAALDLGTARVLRGPRFDPINALPVLPQVADHIAFGALAGWRLRSRSPRA